MKLNDLIFGFLLAKVKIAIKNVKIAKGGGGT
jgi:hypothetical protein